MAKLDNSVGARGREGQRGQQCARCQREFLRAAYEMRMPSGTVFRCLRCALTYRPLVVRSLAISLLIGTLLVAINQGNVIVQGDLSSALAWKVPLTYVVPYCVATAGAMLNARRSISNA